MNPEEQRIAIAQVCGWKQNDYPHPIAKSMWYHPAYSDERYVDTDDLPDYLNDLNEIHEAVKFLTQEQRVTYSNALAKVCGTEKEKIFATAAQRAEAFLKTIGKWVNE